MRALRAMTVVFGELFVIAVVMAIVLLFFRPLPARGADPVFTVVNRMPPTFTVVNRMPAKQPAQKKYDPYGYATYAEFHAYLARGVSSWGVLYVGVPDQSVGTYEPHCRVPSGFGGMADGVYDCRHDAATGLPVMEPRVPKTVAGSSGSSSGGWAVGGISIGTSAGTSGSTNCGTLG